MKAVGAEQRRRNATGGKQSALAGYLGFIAAQLEQQRHHFLLPNSLGLVGVGTEMCFTFHFVVFVLHMESASSNPPPRNTPLPLPSARRIRVC